MVRTRGQTAAASRPRPAQSSALLARLNADVLATIMRHDVITCADDKARQKRLRRLLGVCRAWAEAGRSILAGEAYAGSATALQALHAAIMDGGSGEMRRRLRKLSVAIRTGPQIANSLTDMMGDIIGRCDSLVSITIQQARVSSPTLSDPLGVAERRAAQRSSEMALLRAVGSRVGLRSFVWDGRLTAADIRWLLSSLPQLRVMQSDAMAAFNTSRNAIVSGRTWVAAWNALADVADVTAFGERLRALDWPRRLEPAELDAVIDGAAQVEHLDIRVQCATHLAHHRYLRRLRELSRLSSLAIDVDGHYDLCGLFEDVLACHARIITLVRSKGRFPQRLVRPSELVETIRRAPVEQPGMSLDVRMPVLYKTGGEAPERWEHEDVELCVRAAKERGWTLSFSA